MKKYEAVCYSFSGQEVDHSMYLTMAELGMWLVRATQQLPGIERIEIRKVVS